MRRSQAPSMRRSPVPTVDDALESCNYEYNKVRPSRAPSMPHYRTPSMRQSNKRYTTLFLDGLSESPRVADFIALEWGTTGGGYRNTGPRRYGDEENPLNGKRIFLVLYRQQSNKKHKTWTGNGTLEVTAMQTTLKNEFGKTLDVLKDCMHKPAKIHEGALLEIGMKDVEIQQELKTKAECVAQRKEEIENWYQQQEKVSHGLNDFPKRPEHRSVHSLKKPKHSNDDEAKYETPRKIGILIPTKVSTATSTEVSTATPTEVSTATPTEIDTTTSPDSIPNPVKISEYVCMLKPTKLQLRALKLLADTSSSLSKEIIDLTQIICDQPRMLMDLDQGPLVSKVLQPLMYPRLDISYWDSAKLAFVYEMLDLWVNDLGEKCAIVASTQRSLDLLHRHFGYWRIRSQQLDETYNSSDMPKDVMVILLLVGKLPAIPITNCKIQIIYNLSAREKGTRFFKQNCDIQIYTLITAGCLEERQFQEQLGLVQSSDDIEGLLQVTATHELLPEDEDNILNNFKQWQPPFSKEFLNEAFKGEDTQNVRFVFSHNWS